MLIGDRYQVEVEIGRGGMGRVLRAVDTRTLRRVAVKVMDSKLSADTIAVQRFEREMHATTLLEHANTIRVYDFGRTSEDELYLVMELVEGTTVADELERIGALPIERVVRIGLQVARALVAAHANRIVHRDLKPSNVMLRDLYGEHDVVTVLDFGIAELQGSSRLTSTGLVAASPPYCSPEAANGVTCGPPADLYQLGVLLYECLTNRLPFEADSAMGFLYAHVHKTPERPSRQRPGTPAWLDDLVMALLEKDPNRRPESALAVTQVLTRAGSERIVEAPAPQLPAPVVSLAPMAPTSTVGSAAAGEAGGTVTPSAATTGVASRRRWVSAVVIGWWVIVGGAVVLLATRASSGPEETPDAANAPVATSLPDTFAPAPDTAPPPPLEVAETDGSEPDAGPVAQVSPLVDAADTTVAPVDIVDTSDAPPEPKRVAQRVESIPAGAQIYRGGRLLGVAPYTEARIREREKVQLECRIPNRVTGTWRGTWGTGAVVCKVGPPL